MEKFMMKHSIGDGPPPPELLKSFELADKDDTVGDTMSVSPSHNPPFLPFKNTLTMRM
jgi:hypothetical protein